MKKAAIIMAGGTGTRFWPLSRRDRPKQVLSIGDEPVMLDRTIDRLNHFYDYDEMYVITAEEHRQLVKEVCDRLPEGHVIGEPEGRDTAACAGLGGLLVDEWHGGETVIGVFPADHRIVPAGDFAESVETASQACDSLGGIITFGIEPAFPSTGYGYIEYVEDASESVNDRSVFPVQRFTEKPDRDQAETFVDQGRYLWNSGMFFWKAERILSEIEQHMPSLSEGLESIRTTLNTSGDLEYALSEHYSELPETSVDYGIMEQSNRVWTLPVTFEWSDLGTWDALRTIFESDDRENVVIGDVETVDTEQSVIVCADDNQMIGTVGVDNLVVVSTGDAVLVCDESRAEDVKALVNRLTDKGRDDVL
jgi:mannose-1-phosphate guanylyltransferase